MVSVQIRMSTKEMRIVIRSAKPVIGISERVIYDCRSITLVSQSSVTKVYHVGASSLHSLYELPSSIFTEAHNFSWK